jgi:hypothetical protein
MQRNTGLIEGALTPEMAGFNYERIELSVTVLIDPFANRVANTAGLNVRRSVVTIGIDSPVHVSVRPGNVGRVGSDDKFQRIIGCHSHWHAGRDAQIIRSEPPAPSCLVRKARFQDFLIFGNCPGCIGSSTRSKRVDHFLRVSREGLKDVPLLLFGG